MEKKNGNDYQTFRACDIRSDYRAWSSGCYRACDSYDSQRIIGLNQRVRATTYRTEGKMTIIGTCGLAILIGLAKVWWELSD